MEKARPPGRLLPPIFEPPAALAPYATRPAESRGRLCPEPESATRTAYQRDRDRIIHSAAFRRLKHKTQVFVQHEGDYYRTRLTHSLEVAQIARSLARVLALDEDLAETVALAHDLGHTPFGHAGEEALNEATKQFGGFDHNAHALKLVTQIEHRYAEFDGLNLTWETLEGLVKHNGPLIAPSGLRSAGAATATSPASASHAGEAGLGALREQLPGPIASFDAKWPLELASWPGLEAQAAALADDIAYVNHDIDDGLRAGLFSVEDLTMAPLAGPYVDAVLARFGRIELGRLIGEIVRGLMSALVGDVLAETRARLAAAKPASAAAVRAQKRALAAFSPAMAREVHNLKQFLFARMYRHPRVMGSMNAAKKVVAGLYDAFAREPSLLPPDWASACGRPCDSRTASVVRDYIAGMTDNYALSEYARIFHTEIVL